VFSPNGQQLAVTVSGAAQPPDVWVAEVGQAFRQVTFAQHAGVDLTAFVRPELVKFRAHDGLELSGWLYRPPGAAGPRPYVLSFHGGPEGQERPGFRADYQALLSQGIGVFAPNVRGSSGFGKKFVNLDNGELRFNGIKDIKSSVDYLVTNGIADPKRLGITGGSYGGYMTMVGLTEYPELFAAGVNLFGMVNFFTFFQHTQPWMAAISTIEYGDPATQKDLLEKLSPARQARSDSRRHDGAARRQRYERPGSRSGADREPPQGARRSGGVHPVPRRRPRLAEDPEPDSIDGRNGQVLRRASERACGEHRGALIRARPRSVFD
jgi:dipeptidyl aminopeptidase/acylaminoacyl peptidase